MADLTVLSSSPSPLYAHPSASASSFLSHGGARAARSSPTTTTTTRSTTLPLFTSGPRFASRSLLNVSALPPPPPTLEEEEEPKSPKPRRMSTEPAIGSSGRASTSKLTLDTSVGGGQRRTRPPRARTVSERSPQQQHPSRRSPLHKEVKRRASLDSPSSSRSPSPEDQPAQRTTISPTSYLTPPLNTHRNPLRSPPPPPSRSRSPIPRSSSAPPQQISFSDDDDDGEREDNSSSYYTDQFGSFFKHRRRPPPAAADVRRRNSAVLGGGAVGGVDLRELVPPPPPLLRPTTFWRHTQRSGVSGASYSPSSHLVRRSTFVAAGLSYEKPGHDLSALCVESRVGRDRVVVKPGEMMEVR